VRRALGVFHDAAGASYARMRANARESVMDLSVVSLAWFREFHRIRRCLPPEPRRPLARVATAFSLRLAELPPGATPAPASPQSVVGVAASFNAWRPTMLPLRFVAGDDAAGAGGGGRFEGVAELAPGAYAYKFVVDGAWVLLPQRPHATDGGGNVNNVLTVVSPPGYPCEEK
jgi:hypothetical protein